MPVIKDEIFVQKALARKKALRHSKAFPQKVIKIEKDSSSFQGLRAVPTADMAFPMSPWKSPRLRKAIPARWEGGGFKTKQSPLYLPPIPVCWNAVIPSVI